MAVAASPKPMTLLHLPVQCVQLKIPKLYGSMLYCHTPIALQQGNEAEDFYPANHDNSEYQFQSRQDEGVHNEY
jgi:hypothetical protein